jgi:hypothetical protein
MFVTNDTRGLQVSTDGGCTWGHVTGELAPLRMADVAADPVDGATAYAVSDDGGSTDGDGAVKLASNGLFITHDHGQTFARAAGLAAPLDQRLFHSVKLAPSDAMTVYVTSTQNGIPFAPMVHASPDGGATFSSLPLSYQLDGQTPYSLEVMAIDPRDKRVIYVRVFAAIPDVDAGTIPREALLRSIDGGATFTEIWKMNGIVNPSSGLSRGIDGVAVDPMRGLVLVATATGLLSGADPGSAASVTLAATGGLSQAQCVEAHGATIFACASNYAPDNAALAQSADGAHMFSSVMQYVDTVGPIDCPAGTPVGDVCPMVWQMYATGLGIGVAVDGGADGGAPHPHPGCSCALGAAGGGAGFALAIALALLAIVVRQFAARRRR